MSRSLLLRRSTAARYGRELRMPDVLVIAYADVTKAKRLLTADARWISWSRRVERIDS